MYMSRAAVSETPSSLLPSANAKNCGHTVRGPLTPHHYSSLKKITALMMNGDNGHDRDEILSQVYLSYFCDNGFYKYKIKVWNF